VIKLNKKGGVQLLEKLGSVRQKASDILLDLAYRPLGIRRERDGDKVVYRVKRRPKPRTTEIETDSETIYIDDYGQDESLQVTTEDIK
jgi:hypothetical protein